MARERKRSQTRYAKRLAGNDMLPTSRFVITGDFDIQRRGSDFRLYGGLAPNMCRFGIIEINPKRSP